MKTTIRETLTVGTHNGAFQSDEIVAVALIECYRSENVDITRTRDGKVLAKLDLVVDVGGEFSPKDGRFDHHQFRDETHPHRWVSAAGLVHKHLRVGSMQCNDCVCLFHGTPSNTHHCPNCGSSATFGECGHLDHTSLEVNKLIKAVDARDTRPPMYDSNGEFEPLFNAVNNCNLIDIGSKEQDERFTRLVNLFTLFIWGKIPYKVLFSNIKKIGDAESKNKEHEMKKRIRETNKVSEIDGIPIYKNRDLRYVDTRRALGNNPFVFICFDDLSSTYKVSTNTEFSKIVSLGDKENTEFLHPNGFIGGVFDLSKLKIKLEVK